uniref:Uricase n=1 Tax=Caligus rogercresseyi TaxID=217165 RepID=C1BR88_CALRO|nr:Uricase [Caligus rogercresseyi]
MSKESFKILERRYGKSFVKLFHVERRGDIHTAREYEVNTFLTLAREIDYIEGNNEDVIATDSQKNTVYLLAKQHGVESPESFASVIVSHFLKKYPGNVVKATAEVEECVVWKRMQGSHAHAFNADTSAIHFCKVTQSAGEKDQQISGGLKNYRILKTTKSSFVNFLDDEYRSLPSMDDRIFSTVVESEWEYKSGSPMSPRQYHEVFQKIINLIDEGFSGDPKEGIASPSVQQTMYLCQCSILSDIPSISKISMKMPNKHYFSINLSKFKEFVGGTSDNNDVFLPVDKPSGIIECTIGRDS